MYALFTQPRLNACDSTSLKVPGAAQNGNVSSPLLCDWNTSRPACAAISVSPEYNSQRSALPRPVSCFTTSKRVFAPSQASTAIATVAV